MQIHAAAARGDITSIEWCLGRGVPIDQEDGFGNTPLLTAADALRPWSHRRGPSASEETLRFLLARGADPNLRDELGQSATRLVCSSGSLSAVRLLHEAGGDLLAMSDSRYTALVNAAYSPPSQGKLDIFRYLIEQGVPPNAVTDFHETPLSVSAHFGDWAAVRLLRDFRVDPQPLEWSRLHHLVAFGTLEEVRAEASAESDREDRDRFGHTAFLLAVRCGDAAKAQVLLDYGWRLDARARCGKTSLQTAADAGQAQTLRWLLDRGADANERDDFSGTALMEAAESNALPCVEALLREGAQPDLRDHCEIGAIHRATALSVVEALIAASPDSVDAISGTGDWPLKDAADRNDVPLIEALLVLGARVDLTSTGETALHQAVKADAREAALRLLSGGAEVNATDVDQWTPLFSARSREMAQLLLDNGADPDAMDTCSETAVAHWKDPLLRELLA